VSIELDGFNVWYAFNSLLHSSFDHALKHLVILICLKYLFQRFSVINMNSCTILSSKSLSGMSAVLMLPTSFLSLLMKLSFFLLFLIIVSCLSWMNFLLMMMSTNKGA